jgi:hypothetical protein
MQADENNSDEQLEFFEHFKPLGVEARRVIAKLLRAQRAEEKKKELEAYACQPQLLRGVERLPPPRKKL